MLDLKNFREVTIFFKDKKFINFSKFIYSNFFSWSRWSCDYLEPNVEWPLTYVAFKHCNLLLKMVYNCPGSFFFFFLMNKNDNIQGNKEWSQSISISGRKNARMKKRYKNVEEEWSFFFFFFLCEIGTKVLIKFCQILPMSCIVSLKFNSLVIY